MKGIYLIKGCKERMLHRVKCWTDNRWWLVHAEDDACRDGWSNAAKSLQLAQEKYHRILKARRVQGDCGTSDTLFG